MSVLAVCAIHRSVFEEARTSRVEAMRADQKDGQTHIHREKRLQAARTDRDAMIRTRPEKAMAGARAGLPNSA
jgi:hypothetical protein